MNGGAGQDACCILWKPKGMGVPERLGATLARPDYTVRECEDEFEALARVCVAARDRQRAAVLLMVEPRQLRCAVEVAELLERFTPGAVLWVYEAAGRPQLRAAMPGERETWTTPAAPVADVPARPRRGPALEPATKTIADDAVSTTTVKMPAPPKLRLAGDGPLVDGSAAAAAELKVKPAESGSAPAITPEPIPDFPSVPSGGAARGGHLLTDEELAMLLATEPEKGHD